MPMERPAPRPPPGPPTEAPASAGAEQGAGLGRFAVRVLIVALVAALCYLLWRAAHVLLLLFAAVLLAVLIRGLSARLRALTRLPQAAAFALVVLGLFGGVAAVAWLFGAQIAGQFSHLGHSLPELLQRVESAFSAHPIGQAALEQIGTAQGALGALLARLGQSFGSVFGAAADLLLVAFAGFYLAAQPGHYARGLMELAPPKARGRLRKVMEALGEALWLWVKGKLATMAIAGVLTTAGLLALGVKSALALGLIAAAAELAPFIGPILAAVPAVAVAAADDLSLGVYVLVLYLVVQNLESYLILPLIQQRAVSLPPVLTLAALLAFGLLFGPIGVLLAEALAVTGLVLVKMLYVEEALGERTEVPGRDAGG